MVSIYYFILNVAWDQSSLSGADAQEAKTQQTKQHQVAC